MKIDEIQKHCIELAKALYAKQSLTWIRELQVVEKYGPVSLSFPDDAARALLEKTMQLSYLEGRVSGRAEIEDKKQFDARGFNFIGFDDALNVLKAKAIIPPAEFKAVAAEIKAVTFSVQRMDHMGAISAVNKAMSKAVETGEILKDWKKRTPAIFDAYGITPLKSHHIETVYRTNLLSCYNQARFDEGQENDVVVAYQYIGIDDGRHLNDICKTFFDRVYLKNDPIWQRIRPLNHYKCRCSLRYITRYEWEREKLKASTKPTGEEIDLIHEDFNLMPGSTKPGGGVKEYRQKIDKKEKKRFDKLKTIIQILAALIAAAEIGNEDTSD
ncbi:MAG: hypothetical protein GY757_07780 [bacterium]|nr:hypothetical protein [bacterium]